MDGTGTVPAKISSPNDGPNFIDLSFTARPSNKMSSKRKLPSLDRSVTPPASKKTHLESGQRPRHEASSTNPSPPTTSKEHVKIVSWNINGTRPFLQRTLSSFFQPAPTKRHQPRNPSPTTPSPSPPASPDQAKSAPNYSTSFNDEAHANEPGAITNPTSTSPLRDALRRHSWPHLLCLQEVKIAPDDLASQRALKAAANAGTNANAKLNISPSLNEAAPGDGHGHGHSACNDDHSGLLDDNEAHASSSGSLSSTPATRPRNPAPAHYEPTYETHFSLPLGKHIGIAGRVHGVATLIRRDILSSASITTSRPAWDLEGRILIHSFPDHNLVVLNGYWVNGTDHAYHNPVTGHVDGQTTRHDLKLRYHAQILALVLQYQKEGKAVILVGDMNIAPARIDGYPNLRVSPIQHVHNRKDFNEKFLGLEGGGGMNGVDLFRHLHGQQRKYTWHSTTAPHGTVCDRVDLIIASRSLVGEGNGAIVDADICDDAVSKAHSDHCPLWVIVDLSRIYQALQANANAINKPTPEEKR